MWSVFFVFLSYLDRNFVKADFLSRALDAEEQGKEEAFLALHGTFCATVSTLGGNLLYQVSDGAEVVRSVVSPGGRLVNCSVTASQARVRSFVHECRLGTRGRGAVRPSEASFARPAEAKTMCREFKERSREETGMARQDKPLTRSKRGFTYPGTLWCGIGNIADDYNQLGEFADTDSCCRTHDYCPDVIHAFSSKYGYTNFKWHSISHCDCDNALKACLRKVNDTSSRVVGQAFFNVIGVSCFEFAYEDQCVEWHWYGGCKRYEKSPVVVLREAAPYDYGGIDVIDELTVPPPKKKDSQKSQEGEQPESGPPSTVSGPEEPSLTNVVTAAEDFIKVLATVSTSQSSTADSDKGENQSSEKKRRKNGGKKKKTTKKQKVKGKGRKRKQKSEASLRMEEGNAVSPSGSKAEEVLPLSNFINESQKREQSSRNTYGVGGGELEPGKKEAPPNEVMKDEPAADGDGVSVTSAVREKPSESDADTLSTSVSGDPRRHKSKSVRRARRKKKQPQGTKTTDNLNSIDFHTPGPTTQAQQGSSGSHTEPEPVTRPGVIPKVKKNRSRQREWKKRKVISASTAEAAHPDNSSAETLNPIPPTGAPTVPPVPAAGRRVSHRLEVFFPFAPDSPRSDFKVPSVEERRLRKRKRKTAAPFPNDNPPFHTSTEDAADGAIHSERGLLATAAPAEQRGKPRTKAAPAKSSGGGSTLTRPLTFAPTLSEGDAAAATAATAMSPIQMSVERARAQFARKKKKKTGKANIA